jgi:hypothetical protein
MKDPPNQADVSAYLRAIDPDIQPTTYVLTDAPCLLGRAKTCQVIVGDERKEVSRVHARIVRNGDLHYILEDLGSANGTFVDMQRVSAPYRLHSGQHIRLGSNGPRLQFVDPEATRLEARLRYDAQLAVFVLDGKPLRLTQQQHKILLLLYQNRDKVCTREEIALACWGNWDPRTDDAALDQAITSVRSRLRQASPPADDLIETSRSIGYRLKL